MVIAPRGAREHHAVWMEGGGGDWGGYLTCLVQKAGVGFYAREFFAFKVEDFDSVGARTAVLY